MSESNTDCPFCGRQPGERHPRKGCPRGRQRAVQAECRAAARRRTLCWAKGPIAYRLPGTDARLTYNPGIPFVRGDNWRAGGVPRDTSAVEDFLKTISGQS